MPKTIGDSIDTALELVKAAGPGETVTVATDDAERAQRAPGPEAPRC